MPSTAEAPGLTGGAIGYDRLGEGQPLVLLHALGLDRKSWAPVLERLAAERDVIVPDMPGFGASAVLDGEGPPDPVALAGAIDRFIDGLDLGTVPHLAGNSLGGWVALEIAAAGKAASVTTLSAAGMWSRPLAPKPSTAHRLVRRLRPLLPLLLRSRRFRRIALAGAVADPTKISPADALGLIAAYASGPGFIAANNAMRAGHFTAWERIDVPMTLAWGELDRVVGPARHAPEGARTLVLPGCGHLPMWDDPELVAEVLLAGSAR